MAFATVVTQVLARTTSLFDGRHQVKMTPLAFVTRVMPIGVMHCGSMVAHNLIYLYLSVPLIQMLKVRRAANRSRPSMPYAYHSMC